MNSRPVGRGWRSSLLRAGVVGTATVIGAYGLELATLRRLACPSGARCSWQAIADARRWGESSDPVYAFWVGIGVGSLAAAAIIGPRPRRWWAPATCLLALLLYPVAMYVPVFNALTLDQRFDVAAFLAGFTGGLIAERFANRRLQRQAARADRA